MAKFSETFLQGLLQPTYQQGLFETAKNIGMTPGLMMAEKQRKEKTERLKGMTPVEQADYMLTTARTPEEILKAQQLKTTAVQQAGVQSMSVIQQQMMDEKDPVRLQELEDSLVDVARQTGQANPSAYIGQADKIIDERTRRANALFAQRENAIGQAYYSVSKEDKETFVSNATQAGFGKIITQLENERMRHENYVEERERQARDARSPLPIPSLEKRIKELPASQRAQFEEQLNEIKKLEPDFKNGETWGTGERERAWRLLDSLDSNLFRANVSIISETNQRITTLNSRLNSINKELRKPASAQESKLFVTQAIEQASAERTFGSLRLDLKSDDPAVQQRAIELATANKNAELERERSQIEAELLELERSVSPASTDTESTNEDDVIDLS